MTKVQLLTTETDKPILNVLKVVKATSKVNQDKGLVWLYTTAEYPLDMYFGLNRRDFRVIHD